MVVKLKIVPHDWYMTEKNLNDLFLNRESNPGLIKLSSNEFN